MQKMATVRFSFEVRAKRCVFVFVSQQKVPDLTPSDCVYLLRLLFPSTASVRGVEGKLRGGVGWGGGKRARRKMKR